MELVVILIIAAGLGFWAYTDAKRLDQRGIRVLNWPPAPWGWLVFLSGMVFGVVYLINRRKAIVGGTALRAQVDAAPDAEPDLPRRFCPKCGTQIVRYAAYCHACGREVERIPL